jgi:hypothetical protein
MAKPLMSDAEIKRRKKAQGTITQTTSTLGLTGLTALGSSALLRRGKLQKVPGIPKKLKNADPTKVKEFGQNTSVVAGGIGGLGGYNFAAYTNAESRKRNQVRKNHGVSAFGIVHD